MKRRKNIHPFREPTARELLKIADRAIEDADTENIMFPVDRQCLADLLAAGVRDLFNKRNRQAEKWGTLP